MKMTTIDGTYIFIVGLLCILILDSLGDYQALITGESGVNLTDEKKTEKLSFFPFAYLFFKRCYRKKQYNFIAVTSHKTGLEKSRFKYTFQILI